MHPTGPRTEEGKQRASLNALKHGLTGQTLILTAEERPIYEAHCEAYLDLHKPSGHPETVLVQCIADDYWRALRGRALQDAHLRQALDVASPTSALKPAAGLEAVIVNEKSLANLSLYVQRLERSIKNNLQALHDLQEKRKEAQLQAEEEVKLLARAHWALGHAYDPAQDFPPERGFVFSSGQVIAMVNRDDLLKEAKLWQQSGFQSEFKFKRPSYPVPEAA